MPLRRVVYAGHSREARFAATVIQAGKPDASIQEQAWRKSVAMPVEHVREG